ncbi:Acyltransferase family protein [Intestinibacter bartlettii DSM 16795]|uniref:acyltransferase family protein n=1 Tax=Intestinibacter bartlettii TaxID=261299 RepID=UPI000163122A|nr:acyltransferase [Intestinibacter bartlettii]EDQ95616.1 hypothetical protein CLOBAR_02321 [Intestinibacter bartlettii DSM 16795]UWO80603.1 acyltransferase [Intestinibacter bartlettii]SKA58634.1 Acyltransferase family protein [Intestinibacter bartlettii DSM 16795]
MELTKKQISITKGIAILFMLILHLFCTKDYKGLFTPLIIINSIPLVYYFGLFGECCVAIYSFCSGYGLMCTYKNNPTEYNKKSKFRLVKLYVNFWIILFIFVVILGFLTGKSDIFPGNLKTFILNFTGILTSYNGAWWYLTTYIFLVLISKPIHRLVQKYNNILLTILSITIYFICYVEQVKLQITFTSPILNWIIIQTTALGTNILPFIIGSIFADKKIFSFIYNNVNFLRFKNIICLFGILSMLLFHSFVETAFVAVFIGITFIILFNLMDIPDSLNKILYYFSKHSTNIWLIHMFFYMIYFKTLVFAPKFPILIFIWLVVLCLISSYAINIFYNFCMKNINYIANVLHIKFSN